MDIKELRRKLKEIDKKYNGKKDVRIGAGDFTLTILEVKDEVYNGTVYLEVGP